MLLIPHLIEEINTSSNSWIKQKKLSKINFEWQKGYGAFTHSHSQIDTVVKYVLSQEEHQRKRPFKEEYLEMLEKNSFYQYFAALLLPIFRSSAAGH